MLNSVIRFFLAGLSAYLVDKGMTESSAESLITYITNLLPALFVGSTTLAWSFSEKKKVVKPVEPEKVIFKEPGIIGKGFRLSQRSLSNLLGVHPDLVSLIKTAIINSPYDFTVIDGLRTLETQKELLANGATLTLKSKHLEQPDGYSHAVDLGYIHDGILDGDLSVYAAINDHIQECAERLGIVVKWGGTFRKANGKPFIDGHHWQIET